MSDSPASSADAERIRDQAAAWMVRMVGGASPRLQRDLDRWLAADPRHEAAYRRLGAQFDGARQLRHSRRFADRPPVRRRRSPALKAAAACALVAIPVAAFLALHRGAGPGALDTSATGTTIAISQPPSVFRIAAPATAIRSVGLADGSVVTLDAASAVEVAFSRDARRLTLSRGRARFSVAHDGRPFTVSAGGGETIARGTVFDVALGADGRVAVALWRGVVDVVPGHAGGGLRSPTRRLAAGEALAYKAGQLTGAATRPPPVGAAWADGAGEFDNVSLGFVIDRANLRAATPIRLGDPTLAGLRVSGRFDTRDGERLARDLARLFDLSVERTPDAILLARP